MGNQASLRCDQLLRAQNAQPVFVYEADEMVSVALLNANTPRAKPEGAGKKKRIKKISVNADIWAGYSEPE